MPKIRLEVLIDDPGVLFAPWSYRVDPYSSEIAPKAHSKRVGRLEELWHKELEWLTNYATDLEAQLENRRAVEEWVSKKESRSARITNPWPRHGIKLGCHLIDSATFHPSTESFYGDNFDEAFAKAAERVRNNSGKEQ